MRQQAAPPLSRPTQEPSGLYGRAQQAVTPLANACSRALPVLRGLDSCPSTSEESMAAPHEVIRINLAATSNRHLTPCPTSRPACSPWETSRAPMPSRWSRTCEFPVQNTRRRSSAEHTNKPCIPPAQRPSNGPPRPVEQTPPPDEIRVPHSLSPPTRKRAGTVQPDPPGARGGITKELLENPA